MGSWEQTGRQDGKLFLVLHGFDVGSSSRLDSYGI